MRRFSVFNRYTSVPRCSTLSTTTPRFCSSNTGGGGGKISDSPSKRRRTKAGGASSNNKAGNGGRVAATLKQSGRRAHLSIRCTSRSSASGGQVKEELRSYFSDDYMDIYHEASSQCAESFGAGNQQAQQQQDHQNIASAPLVETDSTQSCSTEKAMVDQVPTTATVEIPHERPLDVAAVVVPSPMVEQQSPQLQQEMSISGSSSSSSSSRLDAAPPSVQRICSEETLVENLFRPSLGCPTEIALQLRSQQRNLVGAVGPYDDLLGVGGVSPMLLSWQLFDRYDSYSVAPRNLPVVGFTNPPAPSSSTLHAEEARAVSERDIIWV